MFKSMTRLGMLGIVLLAGMSSPVQASSWLGWGQGKKNTAASGQIPGMAAPRSGANGATHPTEALPLKLSPQDMAVVADALEEQNNIQASVKAQVQAHEAEIAARDKISQEQIAQKEKWLAALQASLQGQQGRGPALLQENKKEEPVKKTTSKIKPYVVPRAPVNEWQSIMDAQKRNAPPKGNITVKSPAVPGAAPTPTPIPAPVPSAPVPPQPSSGDDGGSGQTLKTQRRPILVSVLCGSGAGRT